MTLGTLKSVCPFVVGLACLCLTAQGRTADATSSDVPFKLHRDFLIVISGSIGGLDKLVLLLDTGASRTVIDSSIASKLQLPGTPDDVMVFQSTSKAQRVVLPELRFGPIHATSLPVVAMDLSEVRRNFGLHVDVILGMDVLRRRSFAVDYRAKRIVFDHMTSTTFSVRILPRLPYLVVPVAIDGSLVYLQFDTGSNGILLFDTTHLPVSRDPTQTNGTASDAGGSVPVQPVRIKRLLMGDAELRPVRAFAMDISAQNFHAFGGILGARVAGASRLQFDFDRMLLGWDR
jgi:predicted aspartyl protease